MKQSYQGKRSYKNLEYSLFGLEPANAVTDEEEIGKLDIATGEYNQDEVIPIETEEEAEAMLKLSDKEEPPKGAKTGFGLKLGLHHHN